MYAVSSQKTTGGAIVDTGSGRMAHDEQRWQKPYCFFPVDIELGTIKEKLSLFRDASQTSTCSDSDRLAHFYDIKALAQPDSLEQFRLVLVSDRKNDTWCYEFWIGETCYYQSQANVIGHGKEFTDYETAYFLQAFGRSPGASSDIGRKVDLLRAYPPVTTPETVIHLARFMELMKNVPVGQEGRLTKSVHLDRAKQEWTYRFLIDGVCLYATGKPLPVADGRHIAIFQYHAMLDSFHAIMNSKTWHPDALPHLGTLSAIKYDVGSVKPYLGMDASLAKIFEAMANVASVYQKKSSFELDGTTFRLTLDGKSLYDGVIPTAPSDKGLTPRVQILMSALRVALAPITRALNPILQNFDKYRLGAQEGGAEAQLTLREAIQDAGKRISGIKVKPRLDPAKDAVSYDLKAVFDDGKKETFSVLATAASSLSVGSTLSRLFSGFGSKPVALMIEHKKAVLQVLCAPMKEKIYGQYVQDLSEREKVALHWQIHKTSLGELTLGQILDVSDPDDMQVADAFGTTPIAF